MNLFWLHPDVQQNVEWHVDKHVNKIILEATQLLCTAHRVLDGVEYEDRSKTGRKIRRWKLNDDRDHFLYQTTHVNNGCNLWVRNSLQNYRITCEYGLALVEEFHYRFFKSHKCYRLLKWMNENLPDNISLGFQLEMPYLAMPDKYKIENDAFESYRNYYVGEKTHLRKYTNREVPEWFQTK